jgi:hypothetical protein
MPRKLEYPPTFVRSSTSTEGADIPLAMHSVLLSSDIWACISISSLPEEPFVCSRHEQQQPILKDRC